jgi:hypothetical protein
MLYTIQNNELQVGKQNSGLEGLFRFETLFTAFDAVGQLRHGATCQVQYVADPHGLVVPSRVCALRTLSTVPEHIGFFAFSQSGGVVP